MQIRLTKMQGIGNDFIVLDETQGTLGLEPQHYRWLAHRHYGVGADQILTIAAPGSSAVDFGYRVHNANGQEVEHCGNGARCFMRYVHTKALSTKPRLRVQTLNTIIEIERTDAGEISVNMGPPFFDHADIPFVPNQLPHPDFTPISAASDWQQWRIVGRELTVLSMGNPHAVLLCPDVQQVDVARIGPLIQASPAFPQGVNVGFLEVLSADEVRLRVFERGVGETLACGSGACAAVVAGIRLGLLAQTVRVCMRGGHLHIDWAASKQGVLNLRAPVRMRGAAAFVFEAEVDIPDQPPEIDAW